MHFSDVLHGGLLTRQSPYWGLLWLGLLPPPAAHAQGRLVPVNRAAVALPTRLTALDSTNGFHQYTFGTRLSTWPTPVESLRTTKQGQLLLAVPEESVLVGNLLLQGLSCHFYNGRLARLDFAPTSEAYTEELLHALEALYGPGQPAGLDQVAWTGQVVTLVYTLFITTHPSGRRVNVTRQGQVSLRSNALQAEQLTEQAANRRQRKGT